MDTRHDTHTHTHDDDRPTTPSSCASLLLLSLSPSSSCTRLSVGFFLFVCFAHSTLLTLSYYYGARGDVSCTLTADARALQFGIGG